MPPMCNICSYRQLSPRPSKALYHHHASAREVRIMQGVEFGTKNRDYLCPSCMSHHKARLPYGLNICLSASQLHGIHRPRDPNVTCPPDSLHVDWLTIPGATISKLEYAWSLDYSKQVRPMRILLAAGLNDLMKGGGLDTIKDSITTLKNTIDVQNAFHPHAKNELVVATVLNPPKLTWFPDNGWPPAGHTNRLEEIMTLNNWIVKFNEGNGKPTPRFHRFGVKTGRRFGQDGMPLPYKIHQWSQWRQSEPVEDMVHLSDYWRVRMGAAVVRHFEGELERGGTLG